MKKSVFIISLLLTVILCALTCCNVSETENSATENDEVTTAGEGSALNKTPVKLPCAADNVLTVMRMYGYSGKFVEDASFQEKENVAAIEILNGSEKDIRLARIIVTTRDRELLFEVTTLPAYNTITVLEKNAAVFVEGEEIIDIRVDNRVDFESKLSFLEDVFQVSGTGYVFNVKNISDTDVQSDIYVYYKKIDENGKLFGGITFRSKVDGLNAGELKQIPASNFVSDDSRVIFLEYAGV